MASIFDDRKYKPDEERADLEEDLQEGKIPPQFLPPNASCLLISEVKVLLEKKIEQRRAVGDDQGISEALLKSYEYAKRFSAYSLDTIKEVRQIFAAPPPAARDADREPQPVSKDQLEEWEYVTLANLHPDRAEDAKELLRTLERVDSATLQMALDQVSRLKHLQHGDAAGPAGLPMVDGMEM